MSEVLTINNTGLPVWLYNNINKYCPECGAPLFDDGPTDSDGNVQYTQRYCANPYCPGHMAEKIAYMATKLGIPGVKGATALSMIKLRGLKSHLEAIPYWYQDSKPPALYLWEIADIAQVYGLQNKWRELLSGCNSFKEFYDSYPCMTQDLIDCKPILLKAESYFEVKPALSKRIINIMMTGSIDGYSNRKDFVTYLNDKVGKYIQIVEVGKRAHDVDFLVKEPYTVDHSKTGVAINNNIPIVSSAQFVWYLNQELQQLLHEK